jgi:hypothetical protein
MNIFIGGSRAVSKLNAPVRERLDDFIRRGDTILVGDANGADKAVQTHFASRGYRNVLVFCTEHCRNNVGEWPIKSIKPQSRRRDFNYYAAKDIAMAQEAKCGVMLWDAKSRGTLQNVRNLAGAGKRTLLYFAPTRKFHVINTEEDLRTVLTLRENGPARVPSTHPAPEQPKLRLAD